jgi:hypothetical protein
MMGRDGRAILFAADKQCGLVFERGLRFDAFLIHIIEISVFFNQDGVALCQLHEVKSSEPSFVYVPKSLIYGGLSLLLMSPYELAKLCQPILPRMQQIGVQVPKDLPCFGRFELSRLSTITVTLPS